MATENVGILTNAGQALLQQANAGKTKITYTRVVFSTDDNSQLADADVKALTDVKTQNVTIKPPIVMQDPQTGETIIRAVGDNKNLTDGIYIHTYGVYAADDSGKEVLYGVTVTSTPDYLVGFDGRMAQAVAYSYRANIQDTDNVNFTDAGDVYLMQKDLQGYLANYVQVSQLADYAKTVDVNQQLDKKVNIADMRKPASDVAGIDETVIDNRDNTITANGTSYDLSKSGLTSLQIVSSGSFNDLPLGTVFTTNGLTDGPDNIHGYTTTTFYSSMWGGRKVQIAIADNTNLTFLRTLRADTGVWQSWTKLADDSTVVHTADMRKPASDVVGLEDVPQAVVHSALASGVDLNTIVTPGVYPFSAASFTNYVDNGTYWGYLVVTSEGNIVTQTAYATGSEQPLYRVFSGSPASWGPWVRLANDYSVAHLSGANNFDTTPTVNNNPLLLASSLPSDLARLSQDANFTGKLQKGGKDVLTSDNLPKTLTQASKNDQTSGFADSTTDTSGFYFWTEQ